MKQLRALGKTLASAVLSHDVETILAHDRPDLRTEDRTAFKNRKSDLYCFLFDSTCTTAKASVHSILTSARRLDVDAQMLGNMNGIQYAWLLFFDGATIRRTDLRSQAFLCEHVGQIASWMFTLDKGQWVSAHSPFDAETDALCSPR
jgi:hypothetical protein